MILTLGSEIEIMHESSENIWSRENPMPKRESIVDSIVKDIEEKIVEGKLRPGDKMPPEGEMCEYYSASRNTVREAMKVLSAIGLIKVLRGDGTYVNDTPSSKLMYPALLSLIMSNSDIYTMMEFRDAVEYSAMRIAVDKATDEDIELARRELEKMTMMSAEPGYSIEVRIDADMAFHRAFAMATHNKLIIMIHDLVLQFIRPFVTQCYIKAPKSVSSSAKTHKLMYDALVAKDATLCEQASRENVREWNETMSVTFGDPAQI